MSSTCWLTGFRKGVQVQHNSTSAMFKSKVHGTVHPLQWHIWQRRAKTGSAAQLGRIQTSGRGGSRGTTYFVSYFVFIRQLPRNWLHIIRLQTGLCIRLLCMKAGQLYIWWYVYTQLSQKGKDVGTLESIQAARHDLNSCWFLGSAESCQGTTPKATHSRFYNDCECTTDHMCNAGNNRITTTVDGVSFDIHANFTLGGVVVSELRRSSNREGIHNAFFTSAFMKFQNNPWFLRFHIIFRGSPALSMIRSRQPSVRLLSNSIDK